MDSESGTRKSRRQASMKNRRLISKQTQTPEKDMTKDDDDQAIQDLKNTMNDNVDMEYLADEDSGKKGERWTPTPRQICDICGDSFANTQVLKTHMRRHTGERPYHCTLCEKSFTQKNGLIVHMHTHANDQFECEECGVIFTQLRSLKRHSKYHTGQLQMKRSALGRFKEFKVKIPKDTTSNGVQEYETVFRCDFCDKDFKSGSQLMVHRRIHTDERPFECKTCHRRFKQKITLLDHEATHLPNKPHKCDKCGSSFKQLRTLRQHKKLQICEQKMKHNKMNVIKKDQIGTDPTDGEGDYDQEDQALDMINSNQTIDHAVEQDNVTSERGIGEAVSIRNKGDSDVQFFTYLNSEEGVVELVPCKGDPSNGATTEIETDQTESTAMYVCEYCGKAFKGKRNVLQHQKTHTDERPFVCGVCFKAFKIKATLVEHLETHTEGKPHTCQTCGKCFKTQKCLQNHIGRNICTGVRPYVCETCGKAFMYARYMENHRCIGSAPKLFECEECGKKFTRHNMLTEHRRLHTGERPLECVDCGKKFAKRDLLRRHRFTHKEKQFDCKECGKRFSQKATLRAHTVVHSEDRKHVCDICKKAFKLASSLRNHHKTMHSTDNQAETKPSAYLCSNCGKVFKHLRWMLKHFCEASGLKRFECPVCDKKFDKKQQLEVHSRTHTGVRPYECQECGKCFTQTSSLKDHMVTHTREKNHKCDLCDCAFTRKNSLQRHKLIIHQGIEPFICNKCNLTFKYKKTYDTHIVGCEAVLVNTEEPSETVQTEIVQEIEVEGDGKVAPTRDLEQQVLDNILGNIERAMNGAGIEIRSDVQYQIIVGENANEVTVQVAGDSK